jgi:hypothetical protein
VLLPERGESDLNADDLGPWSPLSVAAVHEVFRGATFPWFVAGGHALELALGRSWRSRQDLDVGVSRNDLELLHGYLADWELYVAAAGNLQRWDGRALSSEHHENNIWARRSSDDPWAFDLTIGGGDAEVWWSRRDPGITLPWTIAVEHAGGVPYLAPQLQLLMKAKSPRPKDTVDAEVVIPVLERSQRRWLAEHLPRSHPWQRLGQ